VVAKEVGVSRRSNHPLGVGGMGGMARVEEVPNAIGQFAMRSLHPRRADAANQLSQQAPWYNYDQENEMALSERNCNTRAGR
jgi:hypothetical protein